MELDFSCKKKYMYGYCGKTLIVLAYSKKQIAEHFEIEPQSLTGCCYECLPGCDKKVDLDLTIIEDKKSKFASQRGNEK